MMKLLENHFCQNVNGQTQRLFSDPSLGYIREPSLDLSWHIYICIAIWLFVTVAVHQLTVLLLKFSFSSVRQQVRRMSIVMQLNIGSMNGYYCIRSIVRSKMSTKYLNKLSILQVLCCALGGCICSDVLLFLDCMLKKSFQGKRPVGWVFCFL